MGDLLWRQRGRRRSFGARHAAETHHLALDTAGNAVFGSETQSTDLPVTSSAYQKTRNGPADAFVAKISADGKSLLAATYLGGNGYDAIQGVAVDGAGNIYVGGTTPSTDMPTSSNAYQKTSGGNGDAWAAWLPANLSRIQYMTYLAAGQDDQQRSLWIDGAGNIVSTGQTASASFPVTAGAQQGTYAGGTADAYVAKLIAH